MLPARASVAALALTGIACGPLRPPALDPSGLADPAWTERDAFAEAALRVHVEAAPSPPPPPPALAPAEPRSPVSPSGCPFRWVPKDLSASVLRFPAALAGRFMVPIFDAACSCTRPGDHVMIVARVRTLPGDITAVTAARADPDVVAHPGIDACLSTVLGDWQFEGFEVGSDAVCSGPPPDPPKTSLGPPFFRFPRRAGCPTGPQSATIVYPVLVDRRGE
jgi:hypothetical protein